MQELNWTRQQGPFVIRLHFAEHNSYVELGTVRNEALKAWGPGRNVKRKTFSVTEFSLTFPWVLCDEDFVQLLNCCRQIQDYDRQGQKDDVNLEE